MNQLIYTEFRGAETVERKKRQNKNTTVLSRLSDFHKKLDNTKHGIKFPISGTENYIVGNQAYEVSQNNYLISSAGRHIEAHVKSQRDVIGICVGFTQNFMSELAYTVNQKLEDGVEQPFSNDYHFDFIVSKNNIKDDDDLSLAINQIKADFIQNKTHHYENEQFYIGLGELLIKKQLKIRSDIERLPHIKASSKEEIYRRVNLMNDYIHENYKRDITLDKLSQVCYLSKYHALRCYQKINRITPYKKITLLRLEEAKRLLRNGSSIRDTAHETNFSDYRAFSKKFKMQFDVTPSQYRARLRIE